MKSNRFSRLLAATAAIVLVALSAAAAGQRSETAGRADDQFTALISRDTGGRTPNGPSTGAVISTDTRYARLIAFQSMASDLVRGDGNREEDVFVAIRGGSYGNKGTPWRTGKIIRVSQNRAGSGGNGRSFKPAVDGAFTDRANCVAFLSEASNLARGDTNRRVDAFLSRGPGDSLTRMRLPSGGQLRESATDVAVSGDCSRVAFISGGELYVSIGGKTRRISAPGNAADPSFAIGKSNDLVFGARGGVFLSNEGTGGARLIVGGGARNPSYDDVRGRIVAYERTIGGRQQVAFRHLGRGEVVASKCGSAGNRDSRDPMIGNTGHYVTFESDATNLCTRASRVKEDRNGEADTYLYTDTRKLTLVQSVLEKGQAEGGKRPGMAYYANYIVFDSPAPIGSRREGDRQVYMRYLGAI